MAAKFKLAHDLQGQVALVTGANTGIGRVTALELAKRGAHVVITGRNLERTQPVLDEIRAIAPNSKIDFIPLELSNFASIRACADAFLALKLPLHILINNAGLAGAKGLTHEGFEITFGVNHVGTFLFTQLLLPTLQASAPARIVTVASRAHYKAKAFDWPALRRKGRSLSGYPEYCTSKFANVLFSAELARRLQGTGVTTYALHPGVVATDVWRAVPWPFRSWIKRNMITPEQGAQTSLYCATSPAVAFETGLYYDQCKTKEVSNLAQDKELARELWERTEAWIKSMH
ncbi:MAG TPA: SDR family oxidoreductase [Burkholderiaceae bacterium]|nr:SDR family oxidoreductase [Burkholderiaceae bacterium]